MRDLLEEVMLLQTTWTALNTPDMARRGRLVRQEIAAWMREELESMLDELPPRVRDLAVEGKDGIGRKTEVPWARVYSESRSPSATDGWYVVYLFSAGGDRVYLAIGQGTTRWAGGELRPRPQDELLARASWARERLANDLSSRSDLVATIELGARTSLGRSYAPGIVAAISYDFGAIPDSSDLAADLRFAVRTLAHLYIEADGSSTLPGELPPEISDALTLAERAAGRRGRGQGYRLTVSERRAVEQRAVSIASSYLKDQGWSVKDVGATSSFDLDARRHGGERLYVEVKGTTSLGAEVVLTHNEVVLHRENHPNTMLALVHSIDLDRSGRMPVATGGTLRVLTPWVPQISDLKPISYRYAVPDGSHR
ncbi:MrcB family domain-containing protein [Microlunatus aurantiacus]